MDITKLNIVDDGSSGSLLVNTTAVIVQNETFVNITLTEAQRVVAIAMSATPGGDSQAITLTLNAGVSVIWVLI